MKTKLFLGSTLFISILLASNTVTAADNIVDKSRDAFINKTLLANWKPAVTSVSTDKPSVEKSLSSFVDGYLGKTPNTINSNLSKTPDSKDVSTLDRSQSQSNHLIKS